MDVLESFNYNLGGSEHREEFGDPIESSTTIIHLIVKFAESLRSPGVYFYLTSSWLLDHPPFQDHESRDCGDHPTTSFPRSAPPHLYTLSTSSKTLLT
ncbi:unnamed protein product [Orchesella dallaii]|uniref:Uncharacterized protein n=1 Tax=Orchesella dallaii TaxID=48710 RepID=A0ABP1PIZ1_9HEXA